MLEGLSPLHLILILAIALLVIGPGKLPETGAVIGRAVRSFRDSMEGREPASVPSSVPGGSGGSRRTRHRCGSAGRCARPASAPARRRRCHSWPARRLIPV
ncbi:MAG: twin-arginine translocase TatA/TatE family subunit [Candidatus Limnocylindrales bacterium]